MTLCHSWYPNTADLQLAVPEAEMLYSHLLATPQMGPQVDDGRTMVDVLLFEFNHPTAAVAGLAEHFMASIPMLKSSLQVFTYCLLAFIVRTASSILG